MLETQVSCVHCARCGFTNEGLGLVTCPRCGEVLGEVVVTRRSGSWLPVILHWVVVVLLWAYVVLGVTFLVCLAL
jgi:hypothetical protein